MVEQDDGSNLRYVVINGNPGRNVEDNRVRLLNFLRPSDGLTWGLRPDEVFD